MFLHVFTSEFRSCQSLHTFNDEPTKKSYQENGKRKKGIFPKTQQMSMIMALKTSALRQWCVRELRASKYDPSFEVFAWHQKLAHFRLVRQVLVHQAHK